MLQTGTGDVIAYFQIALRQKNDELLAEYSKSLAEQKFSEVTVLVTAIKKNK